MSLDVYLTGNKHNEVCTCSHCGNEHVIEVEDTFFDRNITHNLNVMAEEAGIYKCLWRPDEVGIIQAQQLIEPLRVGLKTLIDNPERFKKFNPENGWGDYDGLVQFVKEYLEACQNHPDAIVSAWR